MRWVKHVSWSWSITLTSFLSLYLVRHQVVTSICNWEVHAGKCCHLEKTNSNDKSISNSTDSYIPTLAKCFVRLLKFNMDLSHDISFLFQLKWVPMFTKNHTVVFIAALLIIASTWNQPKSSISFHFYSYFCQDFTHPVFCYSLN